MSNVLVESPQPSGLIAVGENMPPISAPSDAEVDLEILKSVPKKFEIIDEKTANWLVKKVVAARQYAANVAMWAELEKRRALREETTLMFLFGRQIELWAREEIEKRGGKRKSLSLPAGVCGFRSEGAKLIVDDNDAVLAWVRTNLPDAIQTTEHVMKAVLNQHFETTGEIPDSGVHVEAAREKFSIR